ncbi:hypothetical protein AB6A40_004668 [Gnathostoma spinigerum]|uniref:Sugar transporter SWEET n=1 Tax=Gnathostoma spinigerum TaxID=75299 RepID=A0ABD6EKV2_9BILA
MDSILLFDLIKYAYSSYAENLVWNMFLTSTAIHAIILVTSPLQAVIKWCRRKSSDSDTSIPYLFGFVVSGLWLRYALFIGDTKLALLQTYATFMQTFYLLIMAFFRSKKKTILNEVGMVVSVFLLLIHYSNGLPHANGTKLMGRCASGIQILGSLVCPYFIFRVMTTKVIDFIPFALVLFTCVMEIHAIIYSIAIDDYYMLLSNTVFCCMDSCLLSMFFIYPTESNEKKSGFSVTP